MICTVLSVLGAMSLLLLLVLVALYLAAGRCEISDAGVKDE